MQAESYAPPTVAHRRQRRERSGKSKRAWSAFASASNTRKPFVCALDLQRCYASASSARASWRPRPPLRSRPSSQSFRVRVLHECEDFDEAVHAKVTIDSAIEGPIDGSAYCQIKGTIAPKIGFELRLPVTGWSQRFLQLGCGGLCGVLNIRVEHADDCRPVAEHSVALASTDMGHRSNMMGDGSFGDDSQARIDFAYRGVHLTAVASKALIGAYWRAGAKICVLRRLFRWRPRSAHGGAALSGGLRWHQCRRAA